MEFYEIHTINAVKQDILFYWKWCAVLAFNVYWAFFERTNYGNVNTIVSTLPYLTDHLVPIEQHVMFKNCITKLNWKSTDAFHTATSYLFYLRHRIFNAQIKQLFFIMAYFQHILLGRIKHSQLLHKNMVFILYCLPLHILWSVIF